MILLYSYIIYNAYTNVLAKNKFERYPTNENYISKKANGQRLDIPFFEALL